MSYIKKYRKMPMQNFWTFWVTTTISQIWTSINTKWYKYIRLFTDATFTTNNKRIILAYTWTHTEGWNRFWLASIANSNSDITTWSASAITSPDWEYCQITIWSWVAGSPRSKTTWTDYGSKFSGIIRVAWFDEIVLYASHNDTWTINLTIDYVLFNM